MVIPASPSPDPLALTGTEGDDDAGDCIFVTSTSPKFAAGRNTRPNTPRKPRVEPVVEIITPRKRKKVDDSVNTPKKTPTTTVKNVNTPSGRASPTPNGKVKPIPMSTKRPSQTQSKTMTTTPTKKSTPLGKPTPGVKVKGTSTGTPTLGSSLNNALPTPSPLQNGSSTSRKRPRISTPVIKTARTLTFDQEIFESPSSSSNVQKSTVDKDEISRETFLANEALKRQREARNFNYKGDSSAPKLTRSGRVVGQDSTIPSRESQDLDEYGGVSEDVNPLGIQAPIVPDVEVHVDVDVDVRRNSRQQQEDEIMDEDGQGQDQDTKLSISKFTRSYLRCVLSNLNSQNIAINPTPFMDEEKNDALNGIVNLLKGTVERGEGNSALVVGPRGVGKTRTVARALNLLPSTSKTSPIIVRLSGLAQTNDRLAIREMGRQIAVAEGQKVEAEEDDVEEEGNEAEYAPTTLPSHLLALLTQPSPRAIIIFLEEFDLFTEHARQALLYCLLDVVQSIKTGPVETTGRGVAVIGITTRVDTLLLLEKRVKSRFSHRTFRIISPLSSEGMGWNKLLKFSLLPTVKQEGMTREDEIWREDWQFAVEMLLEEERIKRNLVRLTEMTTDVRNLYRPFIFPILSIISGHINFMSVPDLANSVLSQIEGAGWGLQLTKLRGLPHPALGVLIISKHLAYAGREEFNFSQVEEEYLRFSRTKLVGSGKVRWPIGVLRIAFDHLLKSSLLIPASNASVKPQFSKVRCTLSPHEIVGWFKGEGSNILGPELGNWGRMMGGHA